MILQLNLKPIEGAIRGVEGFFKSEINKKQQNNNNFIHVIRTILFYRLHCFVFLSDTCDAINGGMKINFEFII